VLGILRIEDRRAHGFAAGLAGSGIAAAHAAALAAALAATLAAAAAATLAGAPAIRPSNKIAAAIRRIVFVSICQNQVYHRSVEKTRPRKQSGIGLVYLL
jgi:hypothetical protein